MNKKFFNNWVKAHFDGLSVATLTQCIHLYYDTKNSFAASYLIADIDNMVYYHLYRFATGVDTSDANTDRYHKLQRLVGEYLQTA